MLILSRRINESIIAQLPDGSEIKITLTKKKGCQAKIGIEAPDDIVIFREELKNTPNCRN